eukprot:Pgem_evm1s14798
MNRAFAEHSFSKKSVQGVALLSGKRSREKHRGSGDTGIKGPIVLLLENRPIKNFQLLTNETFAR